MSEPSFWRTEIWHPLTLHFPITLLLLASVVKLVTFFLKAKTAGFWQRAGSYMLYAGCMAAWVSIYTGDMADGIVARKICDPTILKDHEIAAYRVAYIFSAATLLDFGLRFKIIKVQQKAIALLVFVLMLAGSGFLVYTGHLGAHVVYQQAGGVLIPSSDCAGYQ